MRTNNGLVLGLLDTSAQIADPELAARCRGLTLAWTRYGYHGRIVEGTSLDAILDQAIAAAYRHCFVVTCGDIVRERWQPGELGTEDFWSALRSWISAHRFVAAGRIRPGRNDDEHRRATDRGARLEVSRLLVDLAEYEGLGRRFQVVVDDEPGGARPVVTLSREPTRPLRSCGPPAGPSPESGRAGPQSDLPVLDLPPALLDHVLRLEPQTGSALSPYLGPGIETYTPHEPPAALSRDQVEFLNTIHRQTKNARRGVFLWNIEPYDDVEDKPEDFLGPVSTLYSVAAGFKPNRILHTHGFHDKTRVVFFDYSPNALAVRKEILTHWDGTDFPTFVRRLFHRHPPPHTFYHLWADLEPAQLEDRELVRMWEVELGRWGGEEAFRQHWQAYRRLEHHFVRCDLLTDTATLLDRVHREPGAVLWFSNAFFTMHSNWHYTLDTRRHLYHEFIRALAEANPGLFLYGSDSNNVGVNALTAGEYWRRYQADGGSDLDPKRLARLQIRM